MSANPVRQLVHVGYSILIGASLGAAALLIDGCASDAPRAGAGGDTAVSTAPQWQVVDPGTAAGARQGALGGNRAGAEAGTVAEFVATRCREARGRGETAFLEALVRDLYAAGVDPATATETLMAGGCGVVASVVRELVAQGGPEVVDPVVDRALSLTGPEMEPVIAAAALVGLDRPAGAQGQDGWQQTYGMAYFSTRAREAPLITAREAGPLYREALPGYGLYTFVLYADLEALPAADRDRYDELLRLIESYVLAPERETEASSASSHAFLVAVEPRRPGARAGVDPGRSTGAGLAAAMRADFAAHLRAAGHAGLARGLRERAGPFLVSSLEPRLVPLGGDAPRLLVDLSDVGAEYLYAVVDAYDRPIAQAPPEPTTGFAAITQRLRAVFPERAGRGLAAAPEDWVTLLVPGEAEREARVGEFVRAPVAVGDRVSAVGS
jgi:hypothetical protein